MPKAAFWRHELVRDRARGSNSREEKIFDSGMALYAICFARLDENLDDWHQTLREVG